MSFQHGNWQKRLHRPFTILLLSLLLSSGLSRMLLAHSQATPWPTIQPELSSSWSDLTFNRLVFSEEGGLDAQGLASQLGYDLSRQWHSGQSLATAIELGDFGGRFPYSLHSIAEVTGLDLERYRLSGVGALLRRQSIGDVVEAIPSLSPRLVDDVPVVAAALRQSGVAYTPTNTIADVVRDVRLASLSLGSLNLSQYSVSALPGLSSTALDRFQGWQRLSLSEIAGLGDVPVTALPQPPPPVVHTPLDEPDLRSPLIVQADIMFGSAEKVARRPVTGSYNEGFQVQCRQANGCPHIELTGQCVVGNCVQLLDPRITPLRGKQWVSRKHKVIGGSGLLVGQEPTGRHPPPFNHRAKLVLLDTDEANGTAIFGLYFRICTAVGCSPYIIGPLPIYQVREKGYLLM